MPEIYEFKFIPGQLVTVENIPDQALTINQCVVDVDGTLKYRIEYQDTAGTSVSGIFPESVVTAAQPGEVQTAPDEITAAVEAATQEADAAAGAADAEPSAQEAAVDSTDAEKTDAEANGETSADTSEHAAAGAAAEEETAAA